MSCTACSDPASTKINIGKGTLSLCGNCYSYVNSNTRTVGANVTASAKAEKHVHIHKDSKVFAGLQFLASHLGEHFATVLDLPHNDLNQYKSAVKEAHYRLPLRVIHPIASGLGLIGMPRKRRLDDKVDPSARRLRTDPSDAPLSDESDEDDDYMFDTPPSSPSTSSTALTTAAAATSLTSAVASSSSSGGAAAATPSSLTAAATPETQSIFLPLPPPGTSATTPMSRTSTADTRGILDSLLDGLPPISTQAETLDAGRPPIPAEIMVYIMSMLDLSSFLRIIRQKTITTYPSSTAGRVELKKGSGTFVLDGVKFPVFCQILGRTEEKEFLEVCKSGLLLLFVQDLKGRRLDTLLGLLQLRLLWPVTRLPDDIEAEIFEYIVSLTGAELITLDIQYEHHMEQRNVLLSLTVEPGRTQEDIAAIQAEQIPNLEQNIELILQQISTRYIPLLGWDTTEEITSAQMNPGSRVSVEFVDCHPTIQNTILNRCKQFNFSTWRYPIMLNWLSRILNVAVFKIMALPTPAQYNTLLANMSSLCANLIDNRGNLRGLTVHGGRIVLGGRSVPLSSIPQHILDSALSLYSEPMGDIQRRYLTTVDIIMVLSYWCDPNELGGDPNEFANILFKFEEEITDIEDPNYVWADIAVNDAQYSALRAILHVIDTTITRYTTHSNIKRSLIMQQIPNSTPANIEDLNRQLLKINAAKLNLCRLLFVNLMPCSATVELYETHSAIISLENCELAIAYLLACDKSTVSLYNVCMDAIRAMLHRVASATVEEIKSDTHLLNITPTGISCNGASKILSCVTHLVDYFPEYVSVDSATYTSLDFHRFIRTSQIPEMHRHCLSILRNVTPILQETFNPVHAMLLRMSKSCESYLFVVTNFLQTFMRSAVTSNELLAIVLANAINSLISSSIPDRNKIIVYLDFIDQFVQIVQWIGNSFEDVMKLDYLGMVSSMASIIAQTPVAMHTLTSVFIGVLPQTIQYNVIPEYISTGNIASITTLLQQYNFSTYGPVIGTCIYNMFKRNYPVNFSAIEAIVDAKINITMPDPVNVDILLNILSFTHLSADRMLQLCTMLTGEKLIQRHGEKYDLKITTADAHKLVTMLMQPRSPNGTLILNLLKLPDRIAITALPADMQLLMRKITDQDDISFIATFGFDYHARINIYSAADKIAYARSMTEAMRHWLLVDGGPNIPSDKLYSFMQKLMISPVASLDQYKPEGMVVTDLFDASWLAELIKRNLPIRLNLAEVLYMHMITVSIDKLEGLSNVRFRGARNEVMIDKFYEYYVPSLYAEETKHKRLYFTMDEFRPRVSVEAFIKQVKKYADQKKLTPMQLLLRSTWYCELIDSMRSIVSDEYRVSTFNEWVGNVATVGYIPSICAYEQFPDDIVNSAVKRNQYVLHELMNTISIAVYDSIRSYLVRREATLKHVMWIYNLIQSGLDITPGLKSPTHGNQTQAHLWLRSFFMFCSSDNDYSRKANFIARCHANNPELLLVEDDAKQTPIDVFDQLNISEEHKGQMYMSVKIIMDDMRARRPTHSASPGVPPITAAAAAALPMTLTATAAAAATAALPMTLTATAAASAAAAALPPSAAPLSGLAPGSIPQ